jgi:hypothetical protein
MNPEYLPYEAIDRYLSSQMEDDEAADFEKKLDSDPEFKAIFEAQKVAYTMVVDFELLKLKEQIKQDLSSPSSFTKFWKWMLGISVFSGLVAVLFFMIKENTSPTTSTPKSGAEINSTQSDRKSNSTKNSGEAEVSSFLTSTNKSKKSLNSSSSELPQNLMLSTPEKYSEPINESTTRNLDVMVSENKKDSVSVEANTTLAKKCTLATLQGTPFVQEPCQNESSGMIQIDPASISAGPTPWTYSLMENEGYKKSRKFINLEKGRYTIYLKDGDNCISALAQVQLNEKKCDRSKSYSFNTTVQSEWEIPMEAETAQIKIVDKAGNIVVQKNVERGVSNIWNGRSESGTPVSGGLYWIVLTYVDGTNEKLELTIIR